MNAYTCADVNVVEQGDRSICEESTAAGYRSVRARFRVSENALLYEHSLLIMAEFRIVSCVRHTSGHCRVGMMLAATKV